MVKGCFIYKDSLKSKKYLGHQREKADESSFAPEVPGDGVGMKSSSSSSLPKCWQLKG